MKKKEKKNDGVKLTGKVNMGELVANITSKKVSHKKNKSS